MEAPEDQSRKRDFLILLITVPVVTDPSLTPGKGQMKHDFEVLPKYYFLDEMIAKGKIEATVVIASNENQPLNVTSPPTSTTQTATSTDSKYNQVISTRPSCGRYI